MITFRYIYKKGKRKRTALIPYYFLLVTCCLAASSCNSYLDKSPDDRTEVNSVEKVTNLLVSAYPDQSPAFLLEYSSDNVTDNGTEYTAQPNQDKIYRWEQVETSGNDDPKAVWQGCYAAVATANEVLSDIEKLGDTKDYQPMKAEALLCRAFGIFQLTNTFCMAWDDSKADTYPGLPYPLKPNQDITDRGTLRQAYQQLASDIETALPLLDDSYLTTPKYHFNRKAAYAFAARFYLYYQKWDKVIEYATKALGVSPTLRAVSSYADMSAQDISNAYINSSESANYMLLTSYSLFGRSTISGSYERYAHNKVMLDNETFRAIMPWDSITSGTNLLIEAHCMYGNQYLVDYPKMREKFEITDKVNQTGYPHDVEAVFTADETLLCRAEAYTMSGNYNAALADMNIWVKAHCYTSYEGLTPFTLTVDRINYFFRLLSEAPALITSDTQRSIKKALHPQGFTVEDGTQTNMIRTILQMRRAETWHQGMRFIDCKRWGIEFSHQVDGEQTLVFKAGDPRGAIQLPIDVVDAGVAANGRENAAIQPLLGTESSVKIPFTKTTF